MAGRRWAFFLTISLILHFLILYTSFDLRTARHPAAETHPIKVSFLVEQGKKGSPRKVRVVKIPKRKVKLRSRRVVKKPKKRVVKIARVVDKITSKKGNGKLKASMRPAKTQHKQGSALFSIPVIPPECNITKPSYPYVARLRRYQGRVLLKVLVDRDGRVSRVLVVKSSGHKVLDEAAVSAAKSWRCKPALSGGIHIPYWLEVPVVFKLNPL